MDRKVGKKIIWLYSKDLTHQMNVYFLFVGCLVKEKLIQFLLLAFFNTITNSKLFQKTHKNFCSTFPSLSLVDFLLCTVHVVAVTNFQNYSDFSCLQAAM